MLSLAYLGGCEHPRTGFWQDNKPALFKLLMHLCHQSLTVAGALGKLFGEAALKRLAKWNLELWGLVTDQLPKQHYAQPAYELRTRLSMELLEEMRH